MKKILLVLLFGILSVLFIGCKKETSERQFLKQMTNVESYQVEGVLDTYYNDTRKQNDFQVFYKSPNFIKVVITNKENADKQIILKNTEGVYVLVPAVNKNFKIKSTWPENASYPYLLQSLAKDIANEQNIVKKEENGTFTIETKTKMHADAVAVTQKITFDKNTNLPSEVLVYDENSNLYMRCAFTKVEIGKKIDNDEFAVNKSMEVVRISYGETGLKYENRVIKQPGYIPEGITLSNHSTVANQQQTEKRSIMTFAGAATFTVVQEYINDREIVYYQEEVGDIIMVMGTVGMRKTNSIQMIHEGIEYTVASTTLSVDEMLRIAMSYVVEVAENK